MELAETSLGVITSPTSLLGIAEHSVVGIAARLVADGAIAVTRKPLAALPAATRTPMSDCGSQLVVNQTANQLATSVNWQLTTVSFSVTTNHGLKRF